MNIQRLAFLLVAIALPCSTLHAQDMPKKLNVVTTLPVLKNIAEEIGKDRVVVESLAEPSQDAHFVQPKPTLMKKMAKADVFIEVGLSLELWGQKVVESSGNSRVQTGQSGRVIASTGVSTMETPQMLSREFGDVHPNGNPHIWLDPINVKQMAANIAAGFARVDSVHQDIYKKNLAEFQRKIDIALFGEDLIKRVGEEKLVRLAGQDQLMTFLKEKKLEAQLGGWLKKAMPLRGKQVVTYHRTWAYFTSRFGFSVAAEIEDKPGIAPSAKHRDEVVKIMTQNKIPIILMEIFHDRVPAQYIADKTGASIVQVPIDVGAIKAANTYFELIDYILDQLVAVKKL